MRLRPPLFLALGTALLSACQAGDAANGQEGAAQEQATVPGDTGDTAPFAGIGEGEVLKFVGTEPFWGGEVGGTTLTYSTPENQDGVQIEVARFAGRGGISYSGMLDGAAPFEMTITSLSCSDGMSDRTYPFAVSLEIGADKRNGCAWSEQHPFDGPENP